LPSPIFFVHTLKVPLGVVMGITFTPPVWIPCMVAVGLASLVGALQATVKMDKAIHVARNEENLFNCIAKFVLSS
jgi:hypothetical protein